MSTHPVPVDIRGGAVCGIIPTHGETAGLEQYRCRVAHLRRVLFHFLTMLGSGRVDASAYRINANLAKNRFFPVTISYLCNYSVCQFVVVLELVRALIEMSWRKRAFLIKRYPRLRRRYLEMPRSPRPTRSKSRRRRWLIYATHPLFALRLVWVNRDSRIFESLIEIRLLIFSI